MWPASLLGCFKPPKPSSPDQFLLHPKGLLNFTGNHCFANALLQCLYQLPEFKELVISNQKSSNKVLRDLAQLFEAMRSSKAKQKDISDKKHKLIATIINTTPEIQIFMKSGGDSRLLFISLMASITQTEKLTFSDPILQLFCESQMKKEIECISCRRERRSKPFEIIEDSLLINVQKQDEIENLFQSKIQKRYCKICREKQDHEVTVSMEKLPRILVLRIGESRMDSLPFEEYKVQQILPISNKRKEMSSYELIGGVFNTNKGYKGVHSVAYVRKDNDKEHFLCYNDAFYSLVKKENIRGYAKILFYCKNVEIQYK